MDLFFNECSLHGQFPDIPTFVDALDALMAMRQTAKKYDRVLFCHRNCQQAAVTHELSLPQAISRIDKNKARVLMSWFGQTGPYWEDTRRHSEDEYIECQGQVVTDTAIGECAYLQYSNNLAQLTSMIPSSWTSPTLMVTTHTFDDKILSEKLVNHVCSDTLEAALLGATPPLQSWDQLVQICLQRFNNLHFSDNSFAPLKGSAFVLGAAKSLLDLLELLSRFKETHHPVTGRSAEGHELYQTYFTGPRAWFTDSSDQEKIDFRHKMTFPHPEQLGTPIFAPFHGKVQTPQMRIHFSWPISSESPLYVLYVGDKITKY